MMSRLRSGSVTWAGLTYLTWSLKFFLIKILVDLINNCVTWWLQKYCVLVYDNCLGLRSGLDKRQKPFEVSYCSVGLGSDSDRNT